MNTTTIPKRPIGLQQFVGKKVNLMEVPNLLHVPEGFHQLYFELRKCRFIKEFSQKINERTIILTLKLREGEVCNYVVISRISQLFSQHRAFISDHGDHLTVELFKNELS